MRFRHVFTVTDVEMRSRTSQHFNTQAYRANSNVPTLLSGRSPAQQNRRGPADRRADFVVEGIECRYMVFDLS